MALHYSRLLAIVLVMALCSSTLAETEINLQWAICDKTHQSVLYKIGKGRRQPYKANNITYYDKSPPLYTAQGLAFRTKVKKHQPISIIKASFDEETGNVPYEADCIWEQYGSSAYFSCGLPSPLYDEKKNIWSDSQIAFAERYHSVDWDRLVPYGPFTNPKWKLHIEGYKATFDDVMATVAGSPLHLMELEVKVDESQGEDAYQRITKYLGARGVVLCEPQLSKTMRLFHALDRPSMVALNSEQSVLMD